MTETVCIPKDRYEFLIGGERLVDMEFDEKVSKKFMQEVKESEDEYRKGGFIKVKDSEHRKKIFDSL